MKIIGLFALSALASGCIMVSKDGLSWVGPKPEAKTADEVIAASTVEYDQYKRSTWISGPKLYRESDVDYYGTTFLMRALWNENEHSTTQLYISDSYYDWRNFAKANDIDGNALPLLEVSRDARGGSYVTEDVAVELSSDYLERHRLTGLSIKVWGNAGDRIVNVPAFYIDGFLRKLDEYRSTTAAQPVPASAP